MKACPTRHKVSYKRSIEAESKDLTLLSQLVCSFMPLVKHWCGYYFKHTGNIEYDELFSESVMALYELFCGHEFDGEQKLRKLAGNNMQGIIRNIALRMRDNLYADLPLETAQEDENGECVFPALLIPDTEDRSFERQETELFEKLKRLLTPEEYLIAEEKYAGASNSAIARQLGVSHTAVAKKLKKIGEKIAAVGD